MLSPLFTRRKHSSFDFYIYATDNAQQTPEVPQGPKCQHQ